MVQIPRLREWREARALTQVELAERAGVSSRSVAGYEAGTGARPPTVRKLAEALDVEVMDLMGEAARPKAQATPPEPEYADLLKEKGFPSSQIAAWLAQNEQDEEFIRRELEKMSPKDFREALLRTSPYLRKYYRENEPRRAARPESETA